MSKDVARAQIMSTAEEYRQKAEEAEKTADKTTDQKIKSAYIEIAKQWRLIAARAERNA